jgi:hypothetical protein
MRTVSFLGACLVLGMSPAWAVDPLGFYVGAGVGESTLQSQAAEPIQIYERPTGWKVFAGWRPVQMFGAELEYANLGSRNSTYLGTEVNSVHASGSAITAFAVGYLPQPLPYLDFYGKIGLGRLRTNNTDFYGPNCGQGVCPLFVGFVGGDTTRTEFAYAAGMQLKFGAPAVRLEYQGFTTSGGDQSLLSLDLAWNF